MLDAIATPFGWLMMRLYELTDNFGWAIILFAIVVALVLLPFMAKSKKSMMRMSRLQPRMMELQKKHEGNPQKLNEEMARLYRENKVSPMEPAAAVHHDCALPRRRQAAHHNDGHTRRHAAAGRSHI